MIMRFFKTRAYAYIAGALVGFILGGNIANAVTRKAQHNTEDAIRVIEKWRDVSDKWEANYNRCMEIVQKR